MNRRSVLLIDDEHEVRRALARILARAGFQVIEAPSGDAGVEVVRYSPVGAVLLDLSMPGRTGDEILRELHAEFRDLPIVIVSGELDPARKRLLRRAGAAACVDKPVDAAQLVATVEAALTN